MTSSDESPNINKRGFPGFTSKYNITRLVHFEMATDVMAAIAREKQIKGWVRSKKIDLIEETNPKWEDLSTEWFAGDSSLRFE